MRSIFTLEAVADDFVRHKDGAVKLVRTELSQNAIVK